MGGWRSVCRSLRDHTICQRCLWENNRSIDPSAHSLSVIFPIDIEGLATKQRHSSTTLVPPLRTQSLRHFSHRLVVVSPRNTGTPPLPGSIYILLLLSLILLLPFSSYSFHYLLSLPQCLLPFSSSVFLDWPCMKYSNH